MRQKNTFLKLENHAWQPYSQNNLKFPSQQILNFINDKLSFIRYEGHLLCELVTLFFTNPIQNSLFSQCIHPYQVQGFYKRQSCLILYVCNLAPLFKIQTQCLVHHNGISLNPSHSMCFPILSFSCDNMKAKQKYPIR